MRDSLQKTEDSYTALGFRGSKLRLALEKDKSYQKILNEKRRKLSRKFQIKSKDRKRYVLSTVLDYEILHKIYQLEQRELSNEDKKVVSFIRTQLKRDWRMPLIKLLDKLLKKYSIGK